MRPLIVLVPPPPGHCVPMRLTFGRSSGKLKRNSDCVCGSGSKFKKCCLPKFKAKRNLIRLPKPLLAAAKKFQTIVAPNPGDFR